jgi:tRNA A-37 threonylcarbamoyl transferase component Bud32/Tol biopolymer transport system component
VSVTDRLAAALADRYRLERQLGQGGMATVYLAADLKHDRQVAIKVLKPELAAVLGAERFVQEIKTTAALQHPHILPLFDSGSADGFLYYVMPYIEGETLRTRLDREKQLGIEEAVRITREVADALDYAHRHGVIHRDIKPENILLHDGRPMVADFGIALAVSAAAGGRMTETGLSLGTPHYMSPEQATAEKDISAKSDVYSLASVLYEMLSGQPPHLGGSAQQIIMKIIAEPVPAVTSLRKSVPANVAAALMKALEKLPADRFETARAFGEALTNPAFRAATLTAAESGGRGDMRSFRSWVRSPWSWGALAIAGATAAFAVVAVRQPTGGMAPTFIQETFTQRTIFTVRFTPDGQTIVFSGTPEYGATPHLFVIRPDSPDPEPFGPDSTHLLSISSSGVAAVLTHARGSAHRLFTRGTLATVPLSGGAPRELAVNVREADWAPDGETMAVVRDSNGVDLLEYPVGTVIARGAGYLSDVRISPSGDAVGYFEHPSKYDDRGVAVIVDRTGRPVARSKSFWGLEGLAWRPDGRSILFSGSGESYSTYAVFDLDRNGGSHLVLSGPGGLTLQDVSRSGRLLVTRDEQPFILMVRGPGAARATNLGIRDGSDLPLLSADGSRLVFADQGTTGGPNYTVLMRGTDGSPVTRLGEGEPMAISPDGRFVLADVPSTPPRLMLYATGPGTSRQLDVGSLALIGAVSGSLVGAGDDLHFTFCGARPDEGMRCYLGATGGEPVKPITPPGTRGPALFSPDGRRVAVMVDGAMRLYPAAGGESQPARGFTGDDRLVRWSPDGHDLWVAQYGDSLAMVYRVNPETGARAELLRIAPDGQPGLLRVAWLSLANDPRVYAYVGFPYRSTLYVVDGVR